MRAPEGKSADDLGGRDLEGAANRGAVGRDDAEGQVRAEGLHLGAAGGAGAWFGERAGEEGVGGEGGGTRIADCSRRRGEEGDCHE